ncbi:MAG: sulfur carrier protein ThiS [Verrucomicrobiae bacterium]|nr:sulfur carrier protein ThiS [Verrucomicrobiae bacterium]
MKVTLNGQEKEFDDSSLSVTAMLARLELTGHPVLVELNGEALLKSEFDDREVADGSIVEIVRMVAGG